jgi:RNA polymerase sporulation-specific sigma factor
MKVHNRSPPPEKESTLDPMNEPISQRKSTESHSFPEERAEIERLLLALRSPEDTPADEDAFGSLMERYLPLIEKTVDRFIGGKLNESDREDLRQEASVVFCSAVQTYDPTREGVEFGLYAKICVGHGLASALRVFRRQRCEGLLSLEGEGLIEQNPGLLGSEVSVAEALIDKERMEALQLTIQRALSPFESHVWWMYVSGASTSSIARTLGKDEKSISNAIYRIRRKLRQVLMKGDNP